MIRAKLIFIYTVLAVFVATFLIGVLAAWGLIQITGAAVSVLIGPSLLGIVATLIRAKHIFDDPEAITKLKQEQFDAILNLKRQFEEEKANVRNEHVQTIDRIQFEQAAAKEKVAAQHLKEREAAKEALAKCQEENRKLRSQLPVPPVKMSPVPGSAGTHRS